MHHQIRDQEMEQPAQVIREEQPHPRDRLRMIKIQLLPRVEVTEAGGKDNRQHRHHKQHHIRARQERTVNAELQIHKISPCRNTGILLSLIHIFSLFGGAYDVAKIIQYARFVQEGIP